VLEDRIVLASRRPIVVEAEPAGKCACTDQFERRERLTRPVQGLEDRADGLKRGRLRENCHGESVLSERVDVGVLYAVEQLPQLVWILLVTKADHLVAPSGCSAVAHCL